MATEMRCQTTKKEVEDNVENAWKMKLKDTSTRENVMKGNVGKKGLEDDKGIGKAVKEKVMEEKA